MMGNADQFANFRTMFRGHLAGADEKELQEICDRLAVLNRDAVLRMGYLRTIKKMSLRSSALFFVPECEKSQEKAEIGGV